MEGLLAVALFGAGWLSGKALLSARARFHAWLDKRMDEREWH